jgi:hypothetical protein
MIKALVFLIIIFASTPSYAKDYNCTLTTKSLKSQPEYYNVITDPKKMQVIYVSKFPGFGERTKIHKITKIEKDIIFFEDRQRYYDQNKKGYVYTGKKTLKRLRPYTELPDMEGHIEIHSYANYELGNNNLEWITHNCEEANATTKKASSKIEFLKKLYEDGALTKEEFEKAKNK